MHTKDNNSLDYAIPFFLDICVGVHELSQAHIIDFVRS